MCVCVTVCFHQFQGVNNVGEVAGTLGWNSRMVGCGGSGWCGMGGVQITTHRWDETGGEFGKWTLSLIWARACSLHKSLIDNLRQ